MNNILILNQSYPNPEKGNVGSTFVHIRAKYYSKIFNVEVVKISSEKSYVYEGVAVTCCENYDSFCKYLKNNPPHIILTHFCESWMNKAALENDIPIITWVHGSEALSWRRILFSLHKKNVKAFFKFIIINLISRRNFHGLIKKSKKSNKIHFVFVSEWMKRITFLDTFASTSKYSIISNPIDTNRFDYKDKDIELRKKILIIRSFNSSKYANDLSIKAILELSKKSYFNELKFTIYGVGIHWEKLTSQIKHFSNVYLVNELLEQSKIPAIHKENGVFLCPTRMDAQGVSMCEAMSSGLVPITSNNTAIPEFVADGDDGFLTEGVKGIVNNIEYLYKNPDKFSQMSERTSLSIKEKCGLKSIIEKEINLVSKIINE